MKVIISAGGTGGHIYPALAIINKIKEEEPNSEFLYIGTHNRMEKDIVPKYDIPFESIEVYGFNKKIFKNIKTLVCFKKSYKRCLEIMKEFKPDIVIGVGGYVTVPVIKAAHKLGIKTVIHEQNSIAGKANIYLSKYVDLTLTSFASSNKYFKNKVALTGNPCASNALKAKEITKESLGFSKDKKLALIVMGSQGAYTVNDIVTKAIPLFRGKDYEVLFVTGNSYYEKVKVKLPKNVKVLPYLENMVGLMKNVDIMVSRAGASTLSEILVLGIPSILIPSPYVPNNHQYINAMDLVSANAALIIEEKNLDEKTLVKGIDSLMGDEKLKKVFKKNLSKLAIKDSSDIIYKEIKGLMKRG